MASTTHPATTVSKPPEFKEGLWTSWIPLTTTYSGHASQCTSKFWQWDTGSDVLAWDAGFGVKVSAGLRCVPQAATTWWDQTWLGPTTETVVSIGPFICPEAFTQVATSVVDDYSTQVACCPSGYLFVDWMPAGVARQCYSDVSADVALLVHTRVQCDTWTQATMQINTSPTIWGAHINGWVFAAEQTAAPPQSPEITSQSPGTVSPPSETVFQSSQTISQSSGTVSPPCFSCNSSNNSNNGNTRSIGIGVGASLAAVGLATLIAGLIMMRRSRKILRAARHGEEVPKDTDTDSRNSHERPVSPADKPAGELYGSDPTFFHAEAPAPQ